MRRKVEDIEKVSSLGSSTSLYEEVVLEQPVFASRVR